MASLRWKKFAKNLQIFSSKRSGPDPVKLSDPTWPKKSRIRIHNTAYYRLLSLLAYFLTIIVGRITGKIVV